MAFFKRIEELKKDGSRRDGAELFNLIEAELVQGLGAYWKAASRILQGSGTILFSPSEAYFALKNNFFSMLFLYSYHRAGIYGDHRIMYVSINQCLRGMVTGCDNILDDEYKKTLETDLPEEGARFRSVVDIMVSDRVLFDILLNAMQRGILSRDNLLDASALSLHALLRSGAQEASEEKGITGILPPEEVLQLVHHYKTGLLFQAPWQIPRSLEVIPRTNTDSMMKALYAIGMGCQIMDDMVDLSHDIRKHRHNYVLSLLYKDAGEEADRQIERILASDNALDGSGKILAAFPKAGAAATEKALLFLKDGLEALFEPRHQILVKPAISFLAERIGAGLIRLE
jgi:hypothetical protein